MNLPSFRFQMILAVVGCLAFATVDRTALHANEPASAHWPAFLGQGRGEIDPQSIPLEWNESKNIAWSAQLPGYGQSSPVIWKDHVYITSVEGPKKDTFYLVCLNLSDGAEKWRSTIANTAPVESSLYVSRAAPTPVVDDNGVYAIFESGDILASDHTGHRLWTRALTKDYGPLVNEFGLAASPVQGPDWIAVLMDHNAGGYIARLSKKTGETEWKIDRSARQSWASPAIVVHEGQPVIVCSSAGSVDVYHPQDGKLLASRTDVGGNTSSTPIPAGESLFLVGASVGRDDAGRSENAKKSNMAVRMVTGPAGLALETVWIAKDAMPTFGSPMTFAGHSYWVNRAGVVFCIDTQTGEQKYAERLAQSMWATPLGIGDRLYIFGKEGVTTVLATGPEFKKLSENRLWDPEKIVADPSIAEREKTEERRRAAANFSGPTQYGVAAVTGSLLIRKGSELVCIRNMPR
ncbi:Pyrrolo-quinoline quinone [Planctopirus limnophila DSM 3776]|uniref:Pyrrolo-quinoline quinone n=2 Tax=Planctopirus TaxID=1649480 RepID=D5SYG5_PLAL2|nr:MULTISPECIES: PQQ-binding-like beta-propeller repeat protein [Planctopirus]ADG67693.1 Pyrrolo-quinoline quinone [Planctopirus limnophila DSM 3776]QDV30772.1 outer membrane biogenesis protein BamB [Planctopirus ephydatiae]